MPGVGRGDDRAVLVVAPTPDGRSSTGELCDLVAAIADAPAATVEVWFLRDDAGGSVQRARALQVQGWRGRVRVVDHLRTWGPVRLLRRLGARSAADHLAGFRLRAWQRSFRPDIVILDDGLGGRVLDSGRDPSVIVRRTPVPPDNAGSEPPWSGRVDAQLLAVDTRRRVAGGEPGRVGGPVWFEPADATPSPPPPDEELAGVRELYGLASDVPLIVWCDDRNHNAAGSAVLDMLAAVDAGGGAAPHAVVVDRGWSRERLAEIERDAGERDQAGRIHPRSAAVPALLFTADVVVVPRGVLDRPTELALLRAGVGLAEPSAAVPGELAGHVVELLLAGRAGRRTAARVQLDASPVVPRLLGLPGSSDW